MLKKSVKLSFGIIMALMASVACMAQISEHEAKKLVEANVCIKKFEARPELIRITRREDLEDDLFALQPKVIGKIFKKTFIFEVSNTGYFVLSPEEVVYVSSTGEKNVLIAVSKDTQETYSLYGCENVEEAFSNLVKQTGIYINSVSEAEKFALLRYTLVEDPERRRWIVNFLQLKHEVENNFFNKFPSNKAGKKFTKWLREYKTIEKKVDLGAEAREEQNGYQSSITHIDSAEKGIIKLLQTKIFVNKTGEYRILSATIIFP